VVNGRNNIPYTKKQEYWTPKELQTRDLSAYNIQTTYIYYEQTYAKIHGWRKVDTKGAERMPQRNKRM
jgi:hypothetical protein